MTTTRTRRKPGPKPKANGATGRRKPGRPRKQRAPTTDDDGVIVLGPHLDRFAAAFATLDAAKAHFELCQSQIDLWLARSPEYRKLQAKLLDAKGAVDVAGATYNGLIAELSKELNLELARCTIEMDSGRVFVIDEHGRKKPARPDKLEAESVNTGG